MKTVLLVSSRMCKSFDDCFRSSAFEPHALPYEKSGTVSGTLKDLIVTASPATSSAERVSSSS